MPQQQKPHRISFYLNDEEKADLDAVKAFYGITSIAAAVRRAIVEHAKQVRQVERSMERAEQVTYSRRVH